MWGSGKASSSGSGFNVAEKRSKAEDLTAQAKEVLRKLAANRKIDHIRDWKVLEGVFLLLLLIYFFKEKKVYFKLM